LMGEVVLGAEASMAQLEEGSRRNASTFLLIRVE